MSRLGRVPPSAGRDVVDRKACFLSLLAQAAVLASIRGPACHLETFGQSNGGVRRPSPNESAGKEGRGDRKAPERSQFARVLVVDRAKLTTNQGEIGQAERTQFSAGGNKTHASVR